MRIFTKQFACAFVLAPLVLVGCGGGGGGSYNGGGGSPASGNGSGSGPIAAPATSSNVTGFAYVAHFAENNVSAYTINGSTGALSEVTGSPFATGVGPVSVEVDPSGKFAYVANGGSNNFTDTISVYAVDASTGALTNVTTTPAGRSSLRSMTADPRGKFVYTTSGGSRTASFEVDAFTIDGTTGALSPVAGNPFFAGTNPSSIAIDPSGKFAYVTNQAAASVSSFAIDLATGTLTSTGRASVGDAPLSVVVDPSGRFAYVAGSGISVYTIDATTGALTEIPGSPFATANGFFSIAIEPTGRFAYVANTAGVSAFAINASSGALSEISGSPFGSGVASITVDSSGKFVYALVESGIAGFAIDPSTGALTEIAGSPLASPTGSSITTTGAIQ